jgi:hypothetical protein
MPRRRRVSFLLAVLCCSPFGGHAFAAGNVFKILHHEALQIENAREGDNESVSFEAYGRRFDLQLAPNERVQRAFGARAGGSVAMKGSVANAPNSWVRMTRSAGGRWVGMFSDGFDVYAVEPAEDLGDALVQPMNEAGGTPVIFRLADALLPLQTAYCGTVQATAESSALKSYESVAEEIGSQSGTALPTKRLMVGIIADYEFARFYDTSGGGTTAEQAIVQRMNIVDGIFSAQLGVKIELAPPTVFRDAKDPFERTDANQLLDELRRYRAVSATEMSRGVTHLMTGRDMDGETVGVAYLGSVCGGGAASSLSEGTRSTTSAALIAAHEIAHNFNAPHDGDANGACASTAESFLMSPRLNGSQQFSSCSVEQMAQLVVQGRCLIDIEPAPVVTPDPIGDDGPSANGDQTAEAGGGAIEQALALVLALALALRVRGGLIRAPRR